MHARAHRNLFYRLFSIAAICAAYILWAAAFIYKWKQDGSLVSVRNAADNLPTLFQQNVITVLIPILLFFIFLIRLKKAFKREMYFGITGKIQIMIIALLCSALAGITFYCFAVKQNKVTVLYHLLYYFIFISLTEEFVIRGVCAYLVRDYSWRVRYLAPNFCFAIMHIFSYADWGVLTPGYILQFVSSDLLGLMAIGCFFQLLKEKSGTIWIPVLIHALLDYSVVLNYL